MKHRIMAFLLCVGVCLTSTAMAGDIYIALADGSTDTMLSDGTGTLNIYFSDDMDVDTGAFLDITSSNPAAVSFTGSSVLNADITVGGAPVFTRWQSSGGGDLSPGFIDELQGFRVNEGTGILMSQVTGSAPFEDSGHVASLNAFLFGSIDFQSTSGSLDDVVISIAPGDGLVVNAGQTVNANYGAFTFTAIPEPTSATILALGLVGLVARRRR